MLNWSYRINFAHISLGWQAFLTLARDIKSKMDTKLVWTLILYCNGMISDRVCNFSTKCTWLWALKHFCGICRRATHNREAAMESRYQNLRKRPVFSAVSCSEDRGLCHWLPAGSTQMDCVRSSFPFLVLLTRATPPETLVFHLGPRLTYFLQQSVWLFLLLHNWSHSMHNYSSGQYLVHHSSAIIRVHVLSNSEGPVILFLAF